MVDSTSKQVLRTIQTEGMRLACASWTSKGCISCGSKNGRIYHHDVRVSKSLIRFFIFWLYIWNNSYSTFSSHTNEVCGIKWSPDEHYLTSGGSDYMVHVWERAQMSTPNAVCLFSFPTIIYI